MIEQVFLTDRSDTNKSYQSGSEWIWLLIKKTKG